MQEQLTIKLKKAYFGSPETEMEIENQTVTIDTPPLVRSGSGRDMAVVVHASTITWAEGKARDLNGVTHIELANNRIQIIRGALTDTRFDPRDTDSGVVFQIYLR